MEGLTLREFYMPDTIAGLKRWLGIKQGGKGASYYRGLKKRSLEAMYWKEIAKHNTNHKGGLNAQEPSPV